MMKYKVTLCNRFKERYYLANEIDDRRKPMCVHESCESYAVDTLELCKDVIRDFLDAPVAKMTLEQVKNEFEDPRAGAIPEDKLIAIQDYYNGRLDMQNQIFEEIDKISGSQEMSLKFDIPFKYNYFSCYSDDDKDVEQEEAYIKIETLDENQ